MSAYEDVEESMEPLLQGWLMEVPEGMSPNIFLIFVIWFFKFDSVMKGHISDVRRIRQIYLPDVVLAYNSVILFMGHITSREILLRSMQLSTMVAAPDSDLLECFIHGGRLQELVTSFAIVSKAIVQANMGVSSKGKSKKKGPEGESMGLWQVSL